MNELELDEVRNTVREHYGKIAAGEACGCAPAGGCCSSAGPGADEIALAVGYTEDDAAAAPPGSNLGLGCGNPVGLASLRPGQTVLDLGSGAGFDAFLAARAVGPEGRVIGVDMTPAMISKARANKVKGGYQNVEFRLGEMESLPVADAAVDVILSNCVINLSPDKVRVFREAFRALRHGGRLAVADVVALRPLPHALRSDPDLHCACVAGAALVDEVKAMLADAGFTEIRIEIKPGGRELIRDWFPGQGLEDHVASATIEAVKP